MPLQDRESQQYPGLCDTKYCQKVILVLRLALGKQTRSALSGAGYPRRRCMDIPDIHCRGTKTVKGLEHLSGGKVKRARIVQP